MFARAGIRSTIPASTFTKCSPTGTTSSATWKRKSWRASADDDDGETTTRWAATTPRTRHVAHASVPRQHSCRRLVSRAAGIRRVSMRHARVRAPHRVSPMTPALSRWIFPSPARRPPSLAAALGIGPPPQVLANRGFADPLNAPVSELARRSPRSARPCATWRAAARLEKAVRAREKILIYGDYDVDGATSVALLMKAIEMAGGAAGWHVPHRLKDGYGMRARSGGSRRRAGGDADRQRGYRNPCGRSGAARGRAGHGRHRHRSSPARCRSAARARRAQSQPRGLPLSREEPVRRRRGLQAGAGVSGRLGWPAEKLRRVSESFLKIVAIATVADVVPLTGENRVMVKHGLDGPALGAQSRFARAAGRGRHRRRHGPIARQVAFQIAPRINAAGRMDTAQGVIELFLTADPARARELAGQLNTQNAERQQVEDGIREACERAPGGRRRPPPWSTTTQPGIAACWA